MSCILLEIERDGPIGNLRVRPSGELVFDIHNPLLRARIVKEVGRVIQQTPLMIRTGCMQSHTDGSESFVTVTKPCPPDAPEYLSTLVRRIHRSRILIAGKQLLAWLDDESEKT